MRHKADLNWIIKEAIKKAKHYKAEAEDSSINVHSEAHDIVKEMMSSYDFTYDPYQVDDLLRTKLASRIEALRQIVATKKAAKLDGHVVDTFTAARLLESYKALDGAGRRRFASMPVHKMAAYSNKGDVVASYTAYSKRAKDAADVCGDLINELADNNQPVPKPLTGARYDLIAVSRYFASEVKNASQILETQQQRLRSK